MRRMKCSSGTALNTVLSGEREGRTSVNNQATPLVGTRLRQIRCSYTTCPPCSLPAKTRTSSRQFLFLSSFPWITNSPFSICSMEEEKNRGCHVHAVHQVSANINLWPGIWMVWCDISRVTWKLRPHPQMSLQAVRDASPSPGSPADHISVCHIIQDASAVCHVNKRV